MSRLLIVFVGSLLQGLTQYGTLPYEFNIANEERAAWRLVEQEDDFAYLG